ncbi:MAG TPA: glycosyltransferase family 39 protein [Acidimicrobiales bacterium]|jgi:4-amino-4-deoxy-L-arabinose transferase-like glycosyltransferase|nr:glycosyltransferase family 39 protein [Acidimicrobiales bacterium]
MSAAPTVDTAGGDRARRQGGRARLGPRLPTWVPVAAAVLAGAALSLPRIGVRSLWLDEAYTVGATAELLDTWRATGGTQALYYALVWPVAQVTTDPGWLRLPSALFGLAAVVAVHHVGRRLGGRAVGVLTAAGLALSWGLARYSVEARSYTLALLLVSLSWLALVAAVQAGDDEAGARRWWRTYFVAVALVPLAHGLATLNYLAQLAALALAPGDGPRSVRRASRVAPLLAGELAVLFLLGAAEVGDWVPPLSLGQLRAIKHLLLGHGPPGTVLGVLAALAVLDVVVRYLRRRDRESWLQLLPAFWALGPPAVVVAISLVRPYAAARYVFPSLPGFLLLIAGLLVRHLATTRRAALAGVLLAPLLLVDQRHVTTNGIEAWRELTACIAANAEPGDRLLTAAAHRSPLDYYWPDHPELAGVEPLSPPEPLGEVRRLYDSLTPEHGDIVEIMLEDPTGSVWFVDRGEFGRAAIAGLAFDAELMRSYRIAEPPWHFEGYLVLARLDPVGSDRPRQVAPCDTVPRPDDGG